MLIIHLKNSFIKYDTIGFIWLILSIFALSLNESNFLKPKKKRYVLYSHNKAIELNWYIS